MDFWKCQTATATPAKPGGFPFGLRVKCARPAACLALFRVQDLRTGHCLEALSLTPGRPEATPSRDRTFN